MKEKITIYSLAEELGMTPSMVSRAFSPTAKIDEEKRKRVLALAERYGYRPNPSAARLSRKSIRIGILLYGKYQPVNDSLRAGFCRAYEKLKDWKIEYTIRTVRADEKRAEECREELFALDGCDGVILSGFYGDACVPMLKEFAERNPNLVFVQNVNGQVPYLFASKHDETVAARLAAEFLGRCLHHSERKNVLLFTGLKSSELHQRAEEAFAEACRARGMTLLRCVDMKDEEAYLRAILPEVFSDVALGDVDGIYVTSGNSVPLCEYLEAHGYRGDLITFDLYAEHIRFLRSGLISAAVEQQLERQAEVAFVRLLRFLVCGEKVPKTVYTPIRLILSSILPTEGVQEEQSPFVTFSKSNTHRRNEK